MLDQQTTQPTRSFDPLATLDAAGVFARGLSESDPAQAQARLCAVLADVGDWRRLDPDRLQALRMLDGQGLRMLEAMLAEYAALGPSAQSQERRLARSAFELCAAFTQAFEHVLKFLRDPKVHKGLLARMPDVVVRLFRHREIEMTLTLFQYDTWQRARWKALHDLYRVARDQGIASAKVVVGQRNGGEEVAVTPEEIYLRVLLLDVAGGGQLLPIEIAATRRCLARWIEGLELQPLSEKSGERHDRAGFCLDPYGMTGLARAASAAADDWRRLDTSRLAAAMEAEIASLRESIDPAAGQRMLLLSRLAPLYAPAPLPVERRGERSEVALATVQIALGGVAGIYRMLRDEARQRSGRSERSAAQPNVDEIVIGEAGIPSSRMLTSASEDGTSATPAGAMWQVRDSSDSGCRIRGRAAELRWLLPGSLMAFRDGEDSPWRLAVVRRLRKILGTNVEIGVERLSVDPQRVVLTDGGAPERDGAKDRKAGRTIGFYLPESAACPRIPIKTLLLPATEYAPGRVMKMLSTRPDLRIRMKEPLEQQMDFVWTSFEFVDDDR